MRSHFFLVSVIALGLGSALGSLDIGDLNPLGPSPDLPAEQPKGVLRTKFFGLPPGDIQLTFDDTVTFHLFDGNTVIGTVCFSLCAFSVSSIILYFVGDQRRSTSLRQRVVVGQYRGRGILRSDMP